MTRPTRFLQRKQILWALFLVYLILAVFGWLFGKQIGFEDAFLACGAVAVLVTVTFLSVYLFTMLWVWIEQSLENRSHRRGKGR